MPTTREATHRPRRRRVGRTLLWAIGALALLGGLGAVGLRNLWAEATPAFRTEPVVVGSIEKTVTALGAVRPKEYVDVGAQVSGQLRKVHVEIGDRVAQGDLLAEIDPTVLATRVRTDEANLDNLRAQVAQLQAELALARQRLVRNQGLYKSNIISQDLLQTSDTQVKVDVAKIAALQAQIAAAQATHDGDVANLGYAKIHAPMGGIVVSQTAREGQTLNTNQSAPTIVRIADLDTMTVWAQVAEADVVRLAPGTPAYFTTLGLPERRWQAKVRQILPTPEIVNNVVLYDVLVDVANGDHVLLPEMTAQVFFVLGEAKDVPLVPMSALRPSRSGAADERMVSVLTGSGPVARSVRIGLTSRSAAVVLSGLEPGDQVIVNEPADSSRAAAAGTARALGMGFRL